MGSSKAAKSQRHAYFGGEIGGLKPSHLEPTDSTNQGPIPSITVGEPYRFGVQEVYSLMAMDLPMPSPAPIKPDTTAYFVTPSAPAIGQATPFNAPVSLAPTNGLTVERATPVHFAIQEDPFIETGTRVEYVIECSSTPRFLKGTFVRAGSFQLLAKKDAPLAVNLQPFKLFPAPGLPRIYWRIGIRNTEDNPGPVPDALTHEPYIFGRISELVAKPVG